MKFSEFDYQRPNLQQVKEEYLNSIKQLKEAVNAEAAIEAVKGIQTVQKSLETQGTLVSIRNSIDTRDVFYEEESSFWE